MGFDAVQRQDGQITGWYKPKETEDGLNTLRIKSEDEETIFEVGLYEDYDDFDIDGNNVTLYQGEGDDRIERVIVLNNEDNKHEVGLQGQDLEDYSHLKDEDNDPEVNPLHEADAGADNFFVTNGDGDRYTFENGNITTPEGSTHKLESVEGNVHSFYANGDENAKLLTGRDIFGSLTEKSDNNYLLDMIGDNTGIYKIGDEVETPSTPDTDSDTASGNTSPVNSGTSINIENIETLVALLNGGELNINSNNIASSLTASSQANTDEITFTLGGSSNEFNIDTEGSTFSLPLTIDTGNGNTQGVTAEQLATALFALQGSNNSTTGSGNIAPEQLTAAILALQNSNNSATGNGNIAPEQLEAALLALQNSNNSAAGNGNIAPDQLAAAILALQGSNNSATGNGNLDTQQLAAALLALQNSNNSDIDSGNTQDVATKQLVKALLALQGENTGEATEEELAEAQNIMSNIEGVLTNPDATEEEKIQAALGVASLANDPDSNVGVPQELAVMALIELMNGYRNGAIEYEELENLLEEGVLIEEDIAAIAGIDYITNSIGNFESTDVKETNTNGNLVMEGGSRSSILINEENSDGDIELTDSSGENVLHNSGKAGDDIVIQNRSDIQGVTINEGNAEDKIRIGGNGSIINTGQANEVVINGSQNDDEIYYVANSKKAIIRSNGGNDVVNVDLSSDELPETETNIRDGATTEEVYLTGHEDAFVKVHERGIGRMFGRSRYHLEVTTPEGSTHHLYIDGGAPVYYNGEQII